MVQVPVADGDALVATATEAGRLARVPLLQPLAIRDFRLLWAGQAVSLLGDQFHMVALAWLVLGLTGSGLALGLVLVAAAIPRAALMLIGGAFADRYAPRSLMLASDLLRGLVAGILAGLVIAGRAELWHLVVMGVIFGAVDAIFFPAINSVVPMIVPAGRLPAANALVQATTQASTLIGPAIAGVLVALVGSGWAFAVDAGSFLVAAVALWAIRGGRRRDPGPAAASAGPTDRPSLFGEIRAGARYAAHDPAIRTLVILSAAFNLAFNGPISVGLAWLADVRFGGDAALYGLLIAGFGAGAVIGAIVAGSLPAPRRQGPLLLSIAAAMGLALAAVGLAPIPLAVLVLLAAIGLGVGYINVVIVAWLQRRVAPEMLGRVMGIVMLASVGLAPVSLAIAGVLVDIAVTGMFLAAGALVLVAVGIGVLSGAARLLDEPAGSGVVAGH